MPEGEIPADEPIISYLSNGERGNDTGPCPDATILAAAVDGTLGDDERTAVVAHLADCDACRTVVAAVMEEHPSADRTEAANLPVARPAGILRPLRVRLVVVAAAAAVILLLALAVLLSDEPPPDTEAVLMAAAKGFGFQALDHEERRSGAAPMARGGIRPVFPRGVILETMPTFRWRPPDAGSTSILLMTPDGEIVWRGPAPASPFAYPKDAPPLINGDEWIWKVARHGRFASAAGTVFRVMSQRELAAYVARMAVIVKGSPHRIRLLVASHWAIRKGYLGQAELLARDFVSACPDDVVGRETLDYILRQLDAEPEPK